jgi:ferrochelatase
VKQSYEAVLLISYGGPEKPDDVLPFLENVLAGTHVPRERIVEVARRYDLFGGVSPVNAESRALVAALVTELNEHGPHVPVYWGNRHWHPFLAEAIQQMADDGVRRAVAFVTSAFGSYPGCRRYLEEIEAARQSVGPDAPQIDKLRLFYNHPGFIESTCDRVRAALGEIPAERRPEARIVYTAHSIPVPMARKCRYEAQLHEACRLVSERLDRADWALVYQSRSGRPSDPWLEPSLGDHLRQLADEGTVRDLVIAPIGYLYENMEIVYDLDVEAASLCDQLGLNVVRSAVVGAHPRFVTMIRELILERTEDEPTRLALGPDGPSPDVCPPDCCPPP